MKISAKRIPVFTSKKFPDESLGKASAQVDIVNFFLIKNR
tara:strand:+ start:1106 stop:1225 length:120 start_codon:yes stop_codon:yes gene_type:complete